MNQDQIKEALRLARQFHDTYERLAPSFGYETRPDTRDFDPESPNGRLMVAVCSHILAASAEKAEPAPNAQTLHEMNNALCNFAMRWTIDGDYMRCRKCKRNCIASRADEDFQHQAGCKAAGTVERRPWQTLLQLLRPLYTHTPAAQPVEPVAWRRLYRYSDDTREDYFEFFDEDPGELAGHVAEPLYTRPPAAQVPAGWKLVPVEPTPAMLECAEWGLLRTGRIALNMWKHMLEAVPAAPEAPEGALQRIAQRLRRAGATLPAPPAEGTLESAMRNGLCIALALVEQEMEEAPQAEPSDLATLTTRGAEAWKDVKDPTAWVEELRGNGPSEDEERAKFEAWAAKYRYKLERFHSGAYAEPDTWAVWEAWKAAVGLA